MDNMYSFFERYPPLENFQFFLGMAGMHLEVNPIKMIQVEPDFSEIVIFYCFQFYCLKASFKEMTFR